MAVPPDKISNDAFAYLLDNQDLSKPKLMRIATLTDLQIGLPEFPAELQITGKLSLSSTRISLLSFQTIYYPANTTVLFVVIDNPLNDSQSTIVLPDNPRQGQTCYIKDESGTSDVCRLQIIGANSASIDGRLEKILNYKHGAFGFIWSGYAWTTIAAAGIENVLDQASVLQQNIAIHAQAIDEVTRLVSQIKDDVSNITVAAPGGGGGTGDVVGPASATNNAVVRFDSTTGKLIKNSGVTIDNSNNTTIPGTLSIAGGYGATSTGVTVSLSGDIDANGNGKFDGRLTVTGGTTVYTDAILGNAAVGSFPYYDGGGNSAVYAIFGHKDLDHSSVVTNYALYQDNTGNTSINASTGKNLYFAINNVAMGAITNDIGSGVDAILFTGDSSTRTDITLGNTTGVSATTIYAGTGDLNIGHNAADRNVNLGTGNNTTEQEVTIGSTFGRSPLVLRAGTGNMYLTGAVSTDFIIGHTTGTGDITVGRSTVSNTINIGNANTATTKTQTINIGAGTTAGTGKATVTVGNAGGASATNIYAGTGGITLSGSATTTITGSTSGQADAYIGTVEIGELPATKTSYPAVYAMFGHKALDHSADGNYALVQSNVGDTYLGAASAKAVVFKNGTSIVGYLDDNEISLTGKPSTAQTVTLGSTTGASSLTLLAGTAPIALSGSSNFSCAPFVTYSPGDVAANYPVVIKAISLGATRRWGIGIDSGNDLNFAYSLNSLTLTTKGYLANGVHVANIDFTGQHRSLPSIGTTLDFIDKTGLIVVSSGQYKNLTSGSSGISINESLPTVELSTARNQKSVFGVISDTEDPNETSREYVIGNWGSVYEKMQDDDRLIINSLGEGAIWVCNINGSLENGDYVTTCEIPGYGMKQDDDLLHNYTVAKITCNCDFSLNNNLYQCEEFIHEDVTYRRAFVGCTYHCG